MNELRSLLAALQSLHAKPEPYLSATVVQVQGSAYRKPGARMLATQERWLAGSISAGCLERDVLSRGLWRVRAGQPVLMRYDAHEDALDDWQGRGCQGVIDVLLEPGLHAQPAYAFAARCMEAETAGVVATVFASERADVPVGAKLMVTRDETAGFDVPWLRMEALAMLPARSSRARVVSRDGVRALVEPVAVPPHLFVFGANHDVVPLVSLSQQLGWTVSLWDGAPRVSTRERLQGVGEYLDDSLAHAVERLDACVQPIAVVMTHDLRRDEDVLRALLPSEAKYIAVLGPRRRTEQLLARCGQAAAQLRGRLFGPAGLAIGGESPAEIALAVVAQAQLVLTADDRMLAALPQIVPQPQDAR
jgi:xanthine/CO dehydrogenase XdhC/CoxF family maturation factor